MAAVAIAQLMVVLDAAIVNIALSSAQPSLGFPDSDRRTELRNTAAVRAPQPDGPAVPASRSAAHR
jgi:hypothetical protein